MAQTFDNSAAKTELPTTQGVTDRRFPPLCIENSSKVVLGGQGPLFRAPSIKDPGKVRLGGQGPIFR